MEQDRFVVTKKVNVGNLPETLQQSVVPNTDNIPAKVERSAKEVHEAYMVKVEKLKAIRLATEEKTRMVANQESIIRSFNKKPA